ncbi:MAG: hypothetical protein C0490_23110 [Marivirga sp.]|nr:hypothetical protein [Marivirga sp.]
MKNKILIVFIMVCNYHTIAKPVRSSNLGLRSMKGLTEDLCGDFIIETRNRTWINVSFVANALLHEEGKSIHSEPVLKRA